MKISLEKIYQETEQYYQEYVKSLVSGNETTIEQSFYTLLKNIKLSVLRQLTPQVTTKIVVTDSTEARDILFLASMEGKRFALEDFIAGVNYGIYASQDGCITEKFNYKELLEGGE